LNNLIDFHIKASEKSNFMEEFKVQGLKFKVACRSWSHCKA